MIQKIALGGNTKHLVNVSRYSFIHPKSTHSIGRRPRKRIKELAELPDYQVWNWLEAAHLLKFGSRLKTYGFYYMLLSYVRYALPFLVIIASLGLYTYSVGHEHWQWPSLDSAILLDWKNVAFWADILGTFLVFGLGGYLVIRSGKFISRAKYGLLSTGVIAREAAEAAKSHGGPKIQGADETSQTREGMQ